MASSTRQPLLPDPTLQPTRTHTVAGSTAPVSALLSGDPTTSLLRHPDRGREWADRLRTALASSALLEAGAHAGRGTVTYTTGGGGGSAGGGLSRHAWRSDWLASALALSWPAMLGAMAAAYAVSFAAWGAAWYTLAIASRGRCVRGVVVDGGGGTTAVVKTAVAAFLLSVEAQQTIGFGTRAPTICGTSAVVLAGQTIYGAMLTAVCAGLIFARVAHPRRTARSLFVSDAACLARRDGVPTLTFRLLDTRRDRARGPSVTAHLFRWAPRSTVEGEALAWRVDDLPLLCGGGSVLGRSTGCSTAVLPPLLLPVTLEHAIDAASPLAGETLSSLIAQCAEIVVTVAAPSPRGDAVAARSYLATELHWGCAFVPAVTRAPGGGYSVDVAAFHRVAPLPDTDGATPAQLADDVLDGAGAGVACDV